MNQHNSETCATQPSAPENRLTNGVVVHLDNQEHLLVLIKVMCVVITIQCRRVHVCLKYTCLNVYIYSLLCIYFDM